MRRGTGETDEAVYAPGLDIDTAVLRLCWKAYDESLPILYENNTFNFHSPDTINCFRVEDLPLLHSTIDERQVLPVFCAQPSCYERLPMIRKLALYLTWRYDHEEKVTEPYCRDEDHVSEGNLGTMPQNHSPQRREQFHRISSLGRVGARLHGVGAKPEEPLHRRSI